MPTASAESPLQSAAVAHCLTDNLDSTWKSSFITLRWRLPQSGLSPTFWQPAHQQSASRPPVTASARDRPRLIVPALSLSACCAASRKPPASLHHALGTGQPITTALRLSPDKALAQNLFIGDRPATCQSKCPAAPPFARAGSSDALLR